MKRIIPVLIAAAIAAVAVVKLRETDPLPEHPEGTWELAEDESAS